MFYDTVSDLLERRPPIRPDGIDVDTTAEAAARLMAVRNVGALLVTRGPRLEGVLTPRDFVLNLEARGLDPTATGVGQLMSFVPRVVGTDRVIDVVRLMLESGVHHLPVTDGQAAVALLSIGDLSGWLTEELGVQVEGALRILSTRPTEGKTR